MSRISPTQRVTDVFLEDVPRPVIALAGDYPAGHRIPPHAHCHAQLVYASEGVMLVTAGPGTWLVPPQRALWVPAGLEHEIRMQGQVHMRTLYVDSGAVAGLPRECGVVEVSPLLRELILAATALPDRYDETGPEGRLIAVILDRLRELSSVPLHLPQPRDSRVLRVTEALQRAPADKRSLTDWAKTAGASERTLARLFRRETGMSFRDWRQQARLIQALVWLAEEQPVTSVALDLGYDSTSAFIAAFKRAFGITPARYFRR
ncbi:MAG: helix-turn-helix transcriptional regulator [Kiloniellales bacterium]|nr:helix-turn-helix transcriptional regulator [Kiloniellales bacterium]